MKYYISVESLSAARCYLRELLAIFYNFFPEPDIGSSIPLLAFHFQDRISTFNVLITLYDEINIECEFPFQQLNT